MPDSVLVDISENIATITFNNPERSNPLSRESYLDIIDALDRAERAEVRCVVFQGAGDAFSSGFDMDAMGSTEGRYASIDEHVRTIQEHEHELVRRIFSFPMPTVSKIDGAAIGDAAGIAIACDIPLASDRAKIGFSHVRFGLSMDCGVSYILPRIVGDSLAMELALTGQILGAEDAHEVGLVNHVFPVNEFEEKSNEIVNRLAEGPPIALKHIKRLIAQGSNSGFEEVLADEATIQAIVAHTDDYAEGIDAISDGRKPEFVGK